jgi:hypothetical protein
VLASELDMHVPEVFRHLAGASRDAAKRVYRSVVAERPDDPVRAWPGTAGGVGRALRVLHVGDCGVRRMDGAHDLAAPLGYPLAMARDLLRFGIGIYFAHYFSVNFEGLPEMDELAGRIQLGGVPDIMLIQVGSAYTRKVILPDWPRVHQLRDELGRRAGRFVFTFYRGLRPCLRVFGRHSTTYRGTDRLERFIVEAQRRWPSAKVVLVVPFRRSPGYRSGESVASRIESDLHSLASRPNVFVFDANDVLGRDSALRCLTGYNLNGQGSELVGVQLAEFIRERLEPARGFAR